MGWMHPPYEEVNSVDFNVSIVVKYLNFCNNNKKAVEFSITKESLSYQAYNVVYKLL